MSHVVTADDEAAVYRIEDLAARFEAQGRHPEVLVLRTLVVAICVGRTRELGQLVCPWAERLREDVLAEMEPDPEEN